MPRTLQTSILLFIFIAVWSSCCLAQDFSADVVNLKDGGHMGITKILVGGNKARFEIKEDSMGPGAVIWDMDQQKYFVLMPARHMYMEFGQNMPQRNFAFWRPSNVNDACPEWRNLVQQLKNSQQLGTCSKVGETVLNGRSAGSGMELRNIQEGSQPGNLFVIPSDYQKMDMGGMMGGRTGAPPQQ